MPLLRHYYFFILLGLFSIPRSQAQEKKPIFLSQAKLDGKIGFINVNGEEVIPFEFDDAYYFTNGLIALNKGAKEVDGRKIGGKWGFWNKHGKEVIPIKYEAVGLFSQGLIPVKAGSKWGYINEKDKVVIEFQFENALCFSENLASVQWNGKWGCINLNGKWRIKPQFDYIDNFYGGLALVTHIERKYSSYPNGLIDTVDHLKYGLIDKQGALVLDTIYDNIELLGADYSRISLGGKKGLIDRTGKIVISISYEDIIGFSEGLISVAKEIIPDSCYNFGYSKLQVDALAKAAQLVYDSLGEYDFDAYLKHPTVKEYRSVSRKLPNAELLYGYINEKEEVVLDYQYAWAGMFVDSFAIVQYRHEKDEFFDPINKAQQEFSIKKTSTDANIIDKNGIKQLKKNEKFIYRHGDNFIMIENQDGVGAYDNQLNLVLQEKYRIIDIIDDRYLKVQQPGTYSYSLIHLEQTEPIMEGLESISKIGKERFLVSILKKNVLDIYEKRYIIMDHKGNRIKELPYDSIKGFLNVNY